MLFKKAAIVLAIGVGMCRAEMQPLTRVAICLSSSLASEYKKDSKKLEVALEQYADILLQPCEAEEKEARIEIGEQICLEIKNRKQQCYREASAEQIHDVIISELKENSPEEKNVAPPLQKKFHLYGMLGIQNWNLRFFSPSDNKQSLFINSYPYPILQTEVAWKWHEKGWLRILVQGGATLFDAETKGTYLGDLAPAGSVFFFQLTGGYAFDIMPEWQIGVGGVVELSHYYFCFLPRSLIKTKINKQLLNVQTGLGAGLFYEPKENSVRVELSSYILPLGFIHFTGLEQRLWPIGWDVLLRVTYALAPFLSIGAELSSRGYMGILTGSGNHLLNFPTSVMVGVIYAI